VWVRNLDESLEIHKWATDCKNNTFWQDGCDKIVIAVTKCIAKQKAIPNDSFSHTSMYRCLMCLFIGVRMSSTRPPDGDRNERCGCVRQTETATGDSYVTKCSPGNTRSRRHRIGTLCSVKLGSEEIYQTKESYEYNQAEKCPFVNTVVQYALTGRERNNQGCFLSPWSYSHRPTMDSLLQRGFTCYHMLSSERR